MVFFGFWPHGFLGKGLEILAAGGLGCDAVRRKGMDVLVKRR
jgi:hypothetical protein